MPEPRKRLTLSFDNGPSPGVTPGVLEELACRELRATFFVCGKDVSDPPNGTLSLTRPFTAQPFASRIGPRLR